MTKEVYYSDYCHRCEYKDLYDGDDPCNDCLNTPFNMDSHKPLYFKEPSVPVKPEPEPEPEPDDEEPIPDIPEEPEEETEP